VCNLTAMGLHAMEQGQKNKWNYIAIVLFFFVRIVVYMSCYFVSHLHDMSIPKKFLGDM